MTSAGDEGRSGRILCSRCGGEFMTPAEVAGHLRALHATAKREAAMHEEAAHALRRLTLEARYIEVALGCFSAELEGVCGSCSVQGEVQAERTHAMLV
jgi:hypothetical protein